MIAPRKFDLLCEFLQALQPVLVMVAGGPAMMAAFLVANGASPGMVANISLPWWITPIAAVLAYFVGMVLKMCYPGLSLPTTANQPHVTVTTPDMGPEHPSTTIEVNGPVATQPAPPAPAA